MKLNKKLTVILSFFVVIGIGGTLYFNHYNSDIQKLTRNYELYNLATSEDLTKNIDLTNDVPLVNIRRLAETEPLAQFALGLHYKKDNKEELAKQWFKKAVDNQFAPAYLEWAMMIEKESPQESEEYLQQAAEKGVNLAKWKLYKKMEDKKDYLSAMLYIEEMAKQGIPTAMLALSDLYSSGNVTVDFDKSFNWLNKAYQQVNKYDVNVVSHFLYYRLTEHYILGLGTSRDDKKAQDVLNKLEKVYPDKKISLYEVKSYLIGMKYFDAEINNLADALDSPDLKMQVSPRTPYVQIMEDEILLEKNPDTLLKIGEYLIDDKRKKLFYGEACEAGSQEGCDKYREINEKEFEKNKQE